MRKKATGLIHIFMVIFALLALPAHAFDPTTDVTNCVLWLDSDESTMLKNGSQVTNWQDKSGWGNYADYQGMGGGDPQYVADGINGRATVRFDGALDLLEVNGDFTTPYTVLYVAKMGGSVNWAVLSGTINTWLLGYHTFGRMDYMGNSITDVYLPWSSCPIADTSTNLYAAVCDGTGTKFYNKGTLLTNNTSAALDIGDLRVGGQDSTFASDCDIAEVIIYGHALTDDEHNDVGWYLQDRYGLSGSYTGPPPSQVGMLIEVR